MPWMGNRKQSLSIILLLCVFSVPWAVPSVSAAEPKTVTLNPIADSHVDEYRPDANYGNKEWLELAEKSSTGGAKEAYIMFDLSEISKYAKVDSAALQLYTPWALTKFKIVGIYYCYSNSWTETEITWNNKPSHADLADLLQDQLVFEGETWCSWNVTTGAEAGLIERKATFTLKVKDEYSNETLHFYSKDCQELEHKPKLVVTYTPQQAPLPTTDPRMLLYIAAFWIVVGFASIVAIIKVSSFIHGKIKEKRNEAKSRSISILTHGSLKK